MNQSDFKAFENTQPVDPPPILSDWIRARVNRDLNPSTWKVFSKLSLVHFFTAVVTLSICPQFGFRLFGEGMGLMSYFMSFGKYGCTAACGFFFLGGSVLAAIFLLRPEEIRVIRSNKIFELGSLTLLSLGFFLMLDVEFVLNLFATWALGSFLGGVITLEMTCGIRSHSNRMGQIEQQ